MTSTSFFLEACWPPPLPLPLPPLPGRWADELSLSALAFCRSASFCCKVFVGLLWMSVVPAPGGVGRVGGVTVEVLWCAAPSTPTLPRPGDKPGDGLGDECARMGDFDKGTLNGDGTNDWGDCLVFVGGIGIAVILSGRRGVGTVDEVAWLGDVKRGWDLGARGFLVVDLFGGTGIWNGGIWPSPAGPILAAGGIPIDVNKSAYVFKRFTWEL